MIYDLVTAFGWLPSEVRAMPLADVRGIARSLDRQAKRSKAKRRG
jgi:hypothetical protein